MVKVVAVYESKYGNTKLVAETIIDGIREASGLETGLSELKEVDRSHLGDYDGLLIGSPNHIGNATRGIRKFIDELGNLDLKDKWIGVFDTYMIGDFEKAVKKMEKQIGKNLPELRLVIPGLSIKVAGMKGPITEGELPKAKEFGVRIAAQIETSPGE